MIDHECLTDLRAEVVDRFGVAPEAVRVVSSPYRICPLGAHIDHQLGCVTAMAIDRGICIAYAPTDSDEVRMTSRDFDGEARFPLNDVPDRRDGDWGNFARGAVRALQRTQRLTTGICGITAGRLDGGGLSSSAAIGVGLLLALEDANQLRVSPEENIELDLAIENDYLGLRIGILDQSAILLSRRGQLTHIDCRTREHHLLAAPSDPLGFTILIAFSGIKQALVGTDYNRRVEECRTAATMLLEAIGRPDATPVLRNVSSAEYDQHRTILRDVPSRRAAHFYSEMERVRLGSEAWLAGDWERFGELMTQSGRSSIDNYQCGSPPLVDLYEILIGTPGVLGARFSGAGFRGCCVALVAPEQAAEIVQRVEHEYHRRQPELKDSAYCLICDGDDGARIL